MSELDYYQILGIDEDATEQEIKKKYRDIAKKNHPDANPGNEKAAKIFKEASEAYSVLSDAEKRRQYDKSRAMPNAHDMNGKKGAGRHSGSPAPDFNFNGGNMSANFEQFFGFRPGSGPVYKDKLNPNQKTKANPIDMAEMFERYMGVKDKK